MRDRKAEIEVLVDKGMVLDERASWVPIATKLKKEQELLKLLDQGKILFEGNWVSIAEAKKRMQSALLQEEQKRSSADLQDISESVKLSAMKADFDIPMAPETVLITEDMIPRLKTETPLKPRAPEVEVATGSEPEQNHSGKSKWIILAGGGLVMLAAGISIAWYFFR